MSDAFEDPASVARSAMATLRAQKAELASLRAKLALAEKALEEAMPVLERAATDEARANLAPTGFKRTAANDRLARAHRPQKRDVQRLAERLYLAMPGATLPPIYDGQYCWGDVDTDHWQFCEAIAEEVIALRDSIEAIRKPLP